MRTIAIIQARMGSTRLSGKVMKELFGKTVLAHVIERVKQSKEIDEIIIATTINQNDDIIFTESVKNGAICFRGSEEDVLSRYYYAAKENNADNIVRITSDCPLIDPLILDEIIKYYKTNKYDIVSNAGSDLSKRTYPRGLDTEIFSFYLLEEAFKNANKQYQREHVTPYIYENSDKVFHYLNKTDYSKYRWTLDTEEDLELITQIYDYLYKGSHNFYLADILALMDKFPELYDINKHVEQKKLNA